MYRSMMQVYIKESDKALEFYKNAFDAEVKCDSRNIDGMVAHAELDVYGQILAICETDENDVNNTMQFCLHFGAGEEAIVRKIYDVIKDGAKIVNYPLGPCEWSSLMVSLIDKYGINWCIFA